MTTNRIVRHIPMQELWSSNKTLQVKRARYLTLENLALMLSGSRVEFFVANVGKPLEEIPIENCFEFWKSEIKPHLIVNPAEGSALMTTLASMHILHLNGLVIQKVR